MTEKVNQTIFCVKFMDCLYK